MKSSERTKLVTSSASTREQDERTSKFSLCPVPVRSASALISNLDRAGGSDSGAAKLTFLLASDSGYHLAAVVALNTFHIGTSLLNQQLKIVKNNVVKSPSLSSKCMVRSSPRGSILRLILFCGARMKAARTESRGCTSARVARR